MDRLLWLVSVLFAALCMYGAACQLRNPLFRTPCWVMIGGGFVLMVAVAESLNGRSWDWPLAMAGCAAICIAAAWNGKRNGNLHLKHHVVRILFCGLLVAGYIFF